MPTLDFQLPTLQDTMEHKITEALSKGSLYEAAAKSIAPEIFGHQDVTWATKRWLQSGPPTRYFKWNYNRYEWP